MSKTMERGPTRVKNYFMFLSIFCTMLLSTMLFSPKAEAATAAGVTIGNIAVASYEDAASNKYTTNSLQVTTVVQSVYSFDIDKDGTKVAPNALVQKTVTPGGIIYYQYKITNTGNAPDNYTLNTTGAENIFLGTPGFTPTSVKVFWDKDGSGKFKTGDPLLTEGVAGTQIPLAAGQSEYIIVEITVPSTGVAAGQTYERNVLLRSINAPNERDNNEDPFPTTTFDADGDFAKGQWSKTTIVNDAVIDVVKSSNVSNIDPSGIITYTLEVKNNGNLDSQGVTVRDVIPGDVALVTGSPTAPAGWTVTYSNVASPVEASSWAFTPAANNPASSGVDIAVTGVRFLTANPIAPGASVSLTFQAKVKPYGVAGALPAAGTINNFGTFDYKLNTGGDVLNKTTNVVPVDINKKLAVKLSPNNTPFTNQTKLVVTTDDAIFTGATPAITTVAALETSTPPLFPSDGLKTTAGTVGANSNIYFRQTVTNNGNTTDTFLISADALAASTNNLVSTLPSGWSVSFFQETDTTTGANNTSPLVGSSTGPVAPGATFNFVTKVTVPSNALATAQNIYIKAVSTTIGTALGSTYNLLSNDYTLLRVTDVTQPGGKIENIGAATSAGTALTVNTTNLALTESSNGTTVSFPLKVTNTGLVNDTFSLGIGATNALPSGWQLDYYDIVASDKVVSSTSTTVTLNDATNFAIGDKIIVAGQTLTVGSKAGSVITFSTGETLTNNPAIAFSPIVKLGSISIVSTGTLAPNGTKDVIAVVTVPVGAAPITKNLDFKIISANNPTSVSALLTVTDSVIVPSFGSFTLTSDNSGTGPAGGVLFYTHVLTNTGNVNENFNLTAVSTVTPADGFTFTIQDGIIFNANGTVSSNLGAGVVFSTITALTPGQYVQFKVKVSIPASASPGTTIDTADITATQTSPSALSKKNVDTTAVVAGFLTLVKTGKTFSKTDAAFQTTGAFDFVKAATANPAAQKAGTSGADLAAPGDVIEYTIQYSNGPSADAVKSRIKDLIPDNTTFLDGNTTLATLGTGGALAAGTSSLKMGATYAAAIASTSLTIGTTDDAAQYVIPAAPGKPYVFFFIGTGATFATELSPNGGTVAKNTSGVIVFRVLVN